MNSEEPNFTSFSPPPPVNSNSSATTAKTSPTTPHQRPSSHTGLSTIVKAQISFLLSTLTADDYARKVEEIDSLIEQHGHDIYFHLLRRLLINNQSKIFNTGNRSNSEVIIYSSLDYRLLIDKVKQSASNPTLSAVFCDALNSIYNIDSFRNFDLNRFLDQVGLNPVEKVSLSISLLSATKKEIEEKAGEIITNNFDSLVEALKDPSIQKNTSDQQLHHLLVFFKSYQAESLSIATQQLDAPAEAARSKFVSKPVPSVLFPLLNNNKEITASDFTQVKMDDITASPPANPNVSLAKVMSDMGYSCCESPTAVRNLLAQFDVTSPDSGNIIRESDVAQVLGMMAGMPTESQNTGNMPWNPNAEASEAQRKESWDVETFVNTLIELQPHLSWVKIYQELDYPELFISDIKGLDILLKGFKTAVKDQQPFPLNVFWGRWTNIDGQFSVLRCISNAPIEIFNINEMHTRRVLTMEDFVTSGANVKSLAPMLTSQSWNSLDFIETLIKLADSEFFEKVRDLFDKASKQTPELVVLGLAQVHKPWSPMHQELINKLLSMFLISHSSSTLVLTRLWQVNPTLFIEGCLDLYKKDAMHISRILDIAQDLKILPQLLQVQQFVFTIDLAALASRREYLNLEKWLQDNISEYGDPFIHDCLDFLHCKMGMEATRDTNGNNFSSVRLSMELLMIQELYDNSSSQMSVENTELLKEVHNTTLQVYPHMSVGSTAEPTSLTAPVPSFSPEVEAEANSYYEKVYRQEISIDEMIKLLSKFKNSPDPRENRIFECMVHNLFDEYQFFPKYPQRELTITSIIFGSLIQSQLVGYMALVALRYVLSALRNPVDSKMFNFGVQALTQFQSRLPEWPQYCSHLLQIPHLQQSHPEIIQYVRAALQANSSNASTSNGEPRPPPMNATDKVDYEVPSEAIQDKILFIVNNVAQSNLDSKVAEMKDILKESHFRWFANYLVVKRASIEPNYHQLYLRFLDALDSQLLVRHVLHETFANIKVLLNSEKTPQSATERSLLKNLGSWLGGMTLARNKPIKHKNIAFKELLIEGYDSNKLIVAIPFVCKVLEQASKSKVFKPPNPWLMAILKLLVELYQFADLKLNLKFEIEVLCKSLSIELKDIEPTSILKDRPPKEPPVQPTDRLIQAFEAPPPPNLQGTQTTGANSVPLPDENLLNILSNVAPYINYIPLFANQPGLRKLVNLTIERAIQEIIGPVVERSVTIACISTKELILKDFAMEPNEEKMRNAAHIMVQNLAGSLALVTCKEPLRMSMVTHLRNLLLQNGFTESISEQAILLEVAENLDLACSIVEKSAMDKAIPEIEENLSRSFSDRKKHRERSAQPYYDMTVFSSISRYMNSLPEPLRLKPSGLLPQQLRVYEDFSRIRMTNQPAPNYEDRGGVRGNGIHRGQDIPLQYPPNEISFDNSQIITAQQNIERFTQYLAELDKLISKNPQASWASLPQNHDIRVLVNQIPLIAAQSLVHRDETALNFSQKVVQLLYKNDSNLSREVYVILLEKLCDISVKVGKEVTAWLLYADDDRKFIVPVVVALIKAGLINVAEQDVQLAKLIESGRPTVIDFTTKLVRECVLKEPAIASRGDFLNSLDALERLTRRGKAPENVILLLEELRRVRDGMREQLSIVFAEWVRIYQHPTSNEKTFANFIMQLQNQGILKGDEISSMFFRLCTEMSVDSYLKQKAAVQTAPAVAFQAVDAFSKLIVLLVKYHSDPEGINNNVAKVNYLAKIISLIVLVIAQAHEQRQQQFNQKPFFRLFTSLLNDLNSYEQQLQPIYFQILTNLSNTFHTLQPSFFPGFTFAWLSLISHRLFMPKLLLAENQKGWSTFHRLLICLFKFLVPFLRNVEMRDTTRLLYKGTLRVLLVLLHDFPEFLCDYHFSFCDVIPSSCIQLRNLILSAFPRNMRLPDPFTPNLKVDLLPEITQSPRVLSDYTSALLANNLKQDVDTYLQTCQPPSFLMDLRNRLLLDSTDQSEGSKYNVPIINALVLYVGIQAINQLQDNKQSTASLTHSASMEIFRQLLNNLDSEGRYLFLSAIANQLRFPNSHTHYFSCILLYLFAESNQELIKEQVTRVLLERLIVNRPHPWGLLITFIELIKNPRYDFWSHSFTRCATDIERLFESVSRSINQV
ncbi:8493_t:CDS:10 [Ambispora leptoticha]|uniref:General negative regulator of transcription subunit 1 n=1 Tax=Ambispora leptoticha TaxID=144679 RepID=A0A9N9FDJ3_9GLOM|nr:8493_t:CDS:10 [Ambispora leptoticha]